MDLSQLHPELLSSRDSEKNSNFDIHNIKAKDKVWWICKKWHSFESSIDSRLAWKGCPYCSNKKVLPWYNDLATTNPELIKERNFKRNLNIRPTEVTSWSNKKIWRKCKSCWNERISQITSRSKWAWCPKCWINKISSKLKNNALWRLWNLKNSNPELVDERDFEKNKDIDIENITSWSSLKVRWICKKCGYNRNTLVHLRSKWAWCPKCAGLIKTDKEFKEEIFEKNPNILILWEYKSAKDKILCECKICWNRWEIKANNLQQWQWCPKCANIKRWENQSLWQEDFELRMKRINPNILVLWKYKTAHSRVKVMCLNCSHKWSPLAWDILRWTWCPNCCHTSTSYIEKFIFYSFSTVLGEDKVLARDKKQIGKELDIYIPILNLAIEPWSRFWHKDKLKEDLKKRKMCEKKCIKLVIIYDSCKDKNTHENLKKNDIIFFEEDLWNIKNREILKWLVLTLFKIANLSCSINEKQWDKISNDAYLSSRQRDTEEFISDLKLKNDKVTVIWEYLWSKKKIKVKCNKCNYEWFAQVWHLLDWKACPKCAWVMLKTNDEFIKNLKEKQPTIISLESYINNKTNIKVRCLICNHEWSARPGNLLQWYWCPECAHKKSWQTTSRKISQHTLDWKFIKEYESISEASKETWILNTSIWNALNWRSKIAWGYIWKYK